MGSALFFVAGSSALASGVEFVEALTIVLAVGFAKSWRDALEGTAVASVALAIMVVAIIFGLLNLVGLPVLQTVIGALLLVFGLKWLRKAILRYSGLKALHDEEATYREEIERFQGRGVQGKRDWFAVSTAFNGVFLEGLEVVFIVIGFGAAGQRDTPYAVPAAVIGAVVAAVIVIAAGITLHRPLKAVPENTMKFVVGIMLTTFGTLWTAEGLGYDWPGRDLFILVLIAVYVVASALMVAWLKRTAQPRAASAGHAAQ